MKNVNPTYLKGSPSPMHISVLSSPLPALSHLNIQLVGILRTKHGTKAIDAIHAIEAAFNAGVKAVEITSNSDAWQEIVRESVKRKLNIGVGSIKNESTAREALGIGAKFLVSPGIFEDVIKVAQEFRAPILPGVYNEPEFKLAIELSVADVKFFPASASTHEELYKAIKEPFRDEFEELKKSGWTIIPFTSHIPHSPFPISIISSPTEFYNLYLKIKGQKSSGVIVIKLPDGKVAFERVKEIAMISTKIHTYSVGGVNDKNLKGVLTSYGAYGVCVGSGMFNTDAIVNGDFKRVKQDASKYVKLLG